MSTEEQDQILGRVTRQRNEAKREVAASEAKIFEYVSDIAQLVKDLHACAKGGYTPGDPFADSEKALSLLKPAEIADSLKDLKETRKRHEDLDEQYLRLTGN